MIRMTTNKNAMVFLVVFLLLLLGAREAFPSGLPPLQTLAAQKQLVGTANAGQSFRVAGLYTFPSGERFAQVEAAGGLAWIRLESGQDPRAGEQIELSRDTYLFREPVVEETAAPVEDLGIGTYGLGSRHPMNPRSLGINAACTNFIRADGNFGAWGTYLMGRINPSEHPSFFNEGLSDLGRVCPRFSQMGNEEKKNFWVWLIASMANYESSCNPAIKAKGVNGTAAGLLQLHLGKEHIYGCRRGMNSLNAKENLQCGLTILNRDLKRTGKIFASSRNYWHVLRPNSGPGSRTLRLARQYKPCF